MPAVLYEKRDHTVIVTLNRPEAMNAINDEVRKGFHDAMVRFRDDDDARTAIVTGAGDKSFSAGADLKEMSAKHVEGGDPISFWETTPAVLMRQIELWKPVIAAVNGFCLAGGLELALACDIRIASENASFALTEVTRGIIPGNGGTQILPRTVPLGRALQMLFTGERIDAREAYRIGLVNRVVPAVGADGCGGGAGAAHQRERADISAAGQGGGPQGTGPAANGWAADGIDVLDVRPHDGGRQGGAHRLRSEAEGCIQGTIGQRALVEAQAIRYN